MIITHILTSLIVGLLFLPLPGSHPKFTLDKNVLNVHHVEYDFKSDPDAYYLSQKILYSPISELRKKIEENQNITLKHRSEAHITVITPPEYRNILSEFISMNEIQDLAHAFNLQKSQFETICLGKTQLDEKQTYYVVVNAQRLNQFREKIQLIYEQRGGEIESFKARDYYPHITVGFTDRDLHYRDGARKDHRSCWGKLILTDS